MVIIAEKTKKRSMTIDKEAETEVRSKNTPANENLRDYNINTCSFYFLSAFQHLLLLVVVD